MFIKTIRTTETMTLEGRPAVFQDEPTATLPLMRVVGWQATGAPGPRIFVGAAEILPSADSSFDIQSGLLAVAPQASGSPYESPFTLLCERHTSELPLRGIIDSVRANHRLPFSGQLADRLEYLADAVREEDEGLMLDIQSVRHFLAFLYETPRIQYPDVVVSAQGYIAAQWRAGSNRLFSATFLPTGDARFVLFVPHPTRTIRLSGLMPISVLWREIRAHKAESWITNEG